jgi:hypothetical protein
LKVTVTTGRSPAAKKLAFAGLETATVVLRLLDCEQGLVAERPASPVGPAGPAGPAGPVEQAARETAAAAINRERFMTRFSSPDMKVSGGAETR